MATAIWSSRVKSLRTISSLSSPGRRKHGHLFLFIYVDVWFDDKWSGRESVLVSSSKLWFLFMCLCGSGPRHNRSLQSIVLHTQGSDYFSLHSHPVAMNKCCLWTSATLGASDHERLRLLCWKMCIVHQLVIYFGLQYLPLCTSVKWLTVGLMVF